MYMMSFFLSEQRKFILTELVEQYYVQRRIICSGGFRHDGRVPPHLYEAFVEVCGILLLVGDAFGYIAVDDDGVVDSARSYAPFLEQFLVCVEATHIWCITHCPLGVT